MSPPHSPTRMRGEPRASAIRAAVERDVETLADHGVSPTLGTVLMTEDAGAVRFMDRKHETCAALGIETRRVDVDPSASATTLYGAVERLADDDGVTALFVQVPLPSHVDDGGVRERIPAAKDVDCFAPENLGRLVAGNPRVVPATPAAVCELCDAYDVDVAGTDAVVVGRTATICRPLGHLLLDRDATVTTCHTATRDLAAHTRRADLLVTAAGVPGLVDGPMVSDGVTVVDISATHVGDGVVGDVDAESVAPKADALTPVPGGVGPLTMACLLRNVVDVTAQAAGVEAALARNEA